MKEIYYCPPGQRLRIAGPFERRESLTPRHEVIAPAVDTLPPAIRRAVLAEFERRAPLQWLGESDTDAPDWLRSITARLIKRKLPVAFDAEETRIRAERMAVLSRREKTFELIARLAAYVGLDLPAGTKQSTPDTIARRCYEPKGWRRLIDVSQTREAENCLREIGFIERRSNLYCSDLALSWYRGKMRAQVGYLKSHAVEDGEGAQLSLFDVRERSVSSPPIRRAELMTRMSGFEALAKEAGHVATFFTLTCPSAYHSMLDAGGPNPAYEGYSVREAQAWLSKVWSRSRSELKRRGITAYGFRIAEPHHDGTPHWHLVLFTLAHFRRRLRVVLRKHWLSDRGGEPGALHHRVKSKAVNYAQGSATGYIAKYVAKNIDGFEVGEDLEAIENNAGSGQPMGEPIANYRSPGPEAAAPAAQSQKRTDATNTVARVRAWASLHGIRQFQQIGGPTVTLYRELRRLRHAVDVVAIERARVPADAGDWARYVESVGGIEAGRNTTLGLWTELTGECNAYAECKGPQIIGIRSTIDMGAHVRTRLQAWRIVRVIESGSPLGPVSITVRVQGESGNPETWSNPQETSMYGPH
jgi:Bacteriophage replication gene A protein (GPA)